MFDSELKVEVRKMFMAIEFPQVYKSQLDLFLFFALANTQQSRFHGIV